MPDCVFEEISAHVDRFSPDDRTDRPALGAVHGDRGTVLVEVGRRWLTCARSRPSSRRGTGPPWSRSR